MESKSIRIQRWTSIAVAAIAVMIAPLALWTSFEKKDRTEARTTHIEVKYIEFEQRIDDIEKNIGSISNTISGLSDSIQKALEDPKKYELAMVSTQLEKLSNDVRSIQSALGSDLERSLSVPLLRKDLAQLKTQLEERSASASKEIDRIYDQNKWFLGLMGTMAIGLLGLAVSNFLRSRKDDS